MPHYLAQPGDALQHAAVKRFDPRFWTLNFPRPMMASVVTSGPTSLRADAVFYKTNDLAGLIWESEDHWDHPLIAYETNCDYRGCVLSFRWQSSGIKPLDQLHGPTLTIEGRDELGNQRAWYVRLWNYAIGAPDDAQITLDFDAMDGGFLLPSEADPVWAGDIDRMFVSLVAPDYDETDTIIADEQNGHAEMSGITCTGPGSTISIGDTFLPEHQMRIATGYDDAYNQTPARLLRNALHLGYRDVINHYVGMSHYYRQRLSAGVLKLQHGGAPLNGACLAWHRDFASRARALGYDLIFSVSYELFDAIAFNGWKQRAENGDPALTLWEPPSALLSPASDGAMAYIGKVAREFGRILRDEECPVKIQIGEPWWWITLDGTDRICLYDDDALDAFGALATSIPSIKGSKTAAQKAMLDKAGELLAASTAEVASWVKDDMPEAEMLLLVYLPTVLDDAAPEAKRANVPLGWADPAFDVLQLEDYDWVTTGNRGATARGVAAMTARLGYPVERQQYFAGFVLNAEHKAQWAEIAAAADAGRGRGVAEVFYWALPQVIRDGFTHFEVGEN